MRRYVATGRDPNGWWPVFDRVKRLQLRAAQPLWTADDGIVSRHLTRQEARAEARARNQARDEA